MAQDSLQEVPDRRTDLPYQVSVSVSDFPTDRSRRVREVRARMAKAPGSIRIALALAAAMLAAGAAFGLERDRAHPAGGTSGTMRRAGTAGTAGVAAAFGYPQRCLSIAVSAAEPDYASAHLNREPGCGTYRGYVNASFHRVDGTWRLILDEGQLFVPNRLLTPSPADFPSAGSATGYPQRCLSVAIALHDARFDRAGFDRNLPCVRDGRWGHSRLSDRARPRVNRPAW